MSEMIFLLLLILGIPSLLGFSLARRRGKNPYLWGFLSGIFPFFLWVLSSRHKPLGKDKGPDPTDTQK